MMHGENRYYQLWKESEEKAKEWEARWWEEKQKRQKLEVQLAKYHEKIFKPNRKPDEEESTEEQASGSTEKPLSKKKRGAKPGHPGITRQKPEVIHEDIEVTLTQCPHCGETDLRKLNKISEHVQEDIVLSVTPKATRFTKQLYYCPCCKNEVCGKGKEEIPNAYIGPTARALAATLRYEIRVPYRQVETLSREVFGLKLTPGALVGFDHHLASHGRPWYDLLKNHLKSTPHIHADETGWRVDGINHFLWIFNNARLAVYHINRSRGSHIPKDMLGENYPGILITDCYSGYNPIHAGYKQKCAAHFLRDNRDIANAYPDDSQTQAFTHTFKEILQRALQMQKDFRAKTITRSQLNKTTKALQKELKEFVSTSLDNPDAETFRQRIAKYRKEILTFLTHTSIDATNNRAERGLRPNVILRKVTFGNRSHAGSTHHETLMSLIQTAKLNGTLPITLLSNLANGCDEEHFKKLLVDFDPAPAPT